jgi:hypothetical protein
MTARIYLLVSCVLFGLVTLSHLLRLALACDMSFGPHHVPPWVSVVTLLVAGYMTLAGWRLFDQGRKQVPPSAPPPSPPVA